MLRMTLVPIGFPSISIIQKTLRSSAATFFSQSSSCGSELACCRYPSMRVVSKSASQRTRCGTSSGTGGRSTTRAPRRTGPYTGALYRSDPSRREGSAALRTARCRGHGLEARRDVQLGIDRIDVVLDRLLLDAELRADLAIRAPALHQREDLQLAWREAAGIARRALGLGDDLGRERRRDDRAAIGHRAQRLRQLIRAEPAVHEVTLRPRGDGLAHVFGLVGPGHDDCP